VLAHQARALCPATEGASIVRDFQIYGGAGGIGPVPHTQRERTGSQGRTGTLIKA
jgi:hypothetical protein